MHLELSLLSIFFIFSMDIKCLYTMFPTIEGLEALNMFLANALFKNPSLQVPYWYYHLLVVCFVKNVHPDRDDVIMCIISSASCEGL